MSQIKIRNLAPKDYGQVADLRRNDKAFPYLQDIFTHIWDSPYLYVPRDMWAVEFGGEMVGCAGYALAETDSHLGLLGLIIKPEYRQQGVGEYVYEALMAKLHAQKVQRVLSMVYDQQKAGLHFMNQRGFREVGRTIVAQLDLAAINDKDWIASEEIIARQNLHFTTLNHFPRFGLVDRLLPIWNRTRPDQPQYWPYNPYNARRLAHEILDSELLVLEYCYVIVTAENQIVAINLNIHDDESRLFTIYTGVDPSFRGQKLGYALKLKLLNQARKHGFKFLVAENEGKNLAMWRINEQLGFSRLQELVIVENVLRQI
jgi:L-amino acid N-acyltransferase YncA